MKLYHAMVAVVKDDPTLCRQFLTDLTVHDQRSLSTIPADETFLWFPYEHGTHLLRFGVPGNPATPLVTTIYENFRGIRALVAEDSVLREIDRREATEIARQADRGELAA